MSDIFICYRKTDSGYAAGHIKDRLDAVFGPERVFLDHESIPVGCDFDPELQRRLRACTVMLLLIGAKWLAMEVDDEPGLRRIDHAGDYVRKEIGIALDSERIIIPVLLDGMRMRDVKPLPEEISAVSGRQYVEVRERNSLLDIEELTERLLAEVPTRDFPRPQARRATTSTASVAEPSKTVTHNEVQLGTRVTGVRLDNISGSTFNGPISGNNSYA